jgi:cysteinyl-tRNA synthetase
VAAIDGVGREDFLYGYNADNVATPAAERAYMRGFLTLAEAQGLEALIIDYCSDVAKVDDSYAMNSGDGFVSFAADRRELDRIPTYPAAPFSTNTDPVTSLAQANNFLYLINPQDYADGDALVSELEATSYDLFVIDLFDDAGTQLTSAQVSRLKTKPGGAARLVIAYMSIGEAEDYRYYWKSSYSSNPPSWIERENPNWPGNYKVRYWEPKWKKILFGSGDAYLDRILASGFDGVYLDIIDGFEYFEDVY